MASTSFRDTIADILSALFVFLATYPAQKKLIILMILSPRKSQTSPIFENKDGKATKESQQRFLDSFHARAVLLIVAISGATASLVNFAIWLSHEHTRCQDGIYVGLQLFTWALLLVQAISITIEIDAIKRFNLALSATFCYGALIVAPCIRTSARTACLAKQNHYNQIILISLSLAGLIFSISLPRHPEIFWNDKIVDGQWRVSIFSRLTYSWFSPSLAFTKSQTQIEVNDLPIMDHYTRAKELHDASHGFNLKKSLATLIIVSHTSTIIRIYVFTILTTLLDFAPQFAIFNLLKALEAHQSDELEDRTALAWAAGLGLIMALKTMIEVWMWWVSYSHLHIPLRVQLSTLIFTKAMRQKDVKGTQKSERESQSGANDSLSRQRPRNDTQEAEELNQDTKTRQGTANLVGIDSTRIAEFCISQNQFIGVFGKIVVSFIFLNKLIGWQALLAGLAVQLLTTPLSIYFAKSYTNAQEKLMKIRDTRLSVVNEALTGIRAVKFAALEADWYAKIMTVRFQELDKQRKAFLADTILVFCWLAGPVLLSTVSIAVYVVLHGSLSASTAFTTVSILNVLQKTFAEIPGLTTAAINAWTSLKRIEQYLRAPEKMDSVIPGTEIAFQHATISWPLDNNDTSEVFVIRDLSFSLPNHQLSIISGPTASGKSLLLAAILGEVDIIAGHITVPVPNSPCIKSRDPNPSDWIIPSTKAFVNQHPWIENRSFRENVLFGLPYDEQRYHEVIFACALEEDLRLMPDGDRTEIGAGGINISGGQRWRLTVARAMYSRAEILVMDDIFSAVDVQVGQHILQHAILGKLSHGRTRICVTHHTKLLVNQNYYSVQLGKDGVSCVGWMNGLHAHDELMVVPEDASPQSMCQSEPLFSTESTGRLHSKYSTLHIEEENSVRSISKLSNNIKFRIPEKTTDSRNAVSTPKKFVEEETRSSGNVGWFVYRAYLKSIGGTGVWVAILSTFIVFEAAVLLNSWWIALWTQSYHLERLLEHRATHFYQLLGIYSISQLQSTDPDVQYYLGVYLCISLCVAFLAAIRYFWIFQGCISASQRLFGRFTKAFLYAPLRKLDSFPMGRVLNRFTTDFSTIDSEMGPAIAHALNYSFAALGIVVAGAIASPYIIPIAIILLFLSTLIASYYLRGAREIKRLENLTRSQVFDLFNTSLAGLSTIRAYDRTDIFITSMFARIDAHCQTIWYMWAFNTWLIFRLGIIGAIFAATMAMLVVVLKGITAPIAGFALVFVLDYSDAVIWALRKYSDVELGMSAMERVLEYSDMAIEDQGGVMPCAAWPTEGALEVTNLAAGYAPDLPPVLSDVSFSIQPNERIGVVGRTGAGKTSLVLAIFRFIEARQGSICIDGLDISKLTLHELRSRLAIVPQDPVLFSGTIRTNLDPFAVHSDDEILKVLQCLHLIQLSDSGSTSSTTGSLSSSCFSSLHIPVSEGGQNFSQGQRQLLCLARAVILRPKILILDEASSAVDKDTDSIIQRSIREEFVNSTLIVIAHRMSTVVDFDKILVMDSGKVVEFGTPQNLIQAGGLFADMLRKSGIVLSNT